MCRTQGANSLRVTHTKCQPDLFKKVCELCTLFAIEIILIVISPSGEVFAYGDPDFDAKMKGLSNNGKIDLYAIRHEGAKRIKKLLKEYSDAHEKLKVV